MCLLPWGGWPKKGTVHCGLSLINPKINPTKEKKLTNMRQSSSDELVRLIPHRILSLEQALEFCREDECVEVTPTTVRMRKVALVATDRAKARNRKM